MTTATAAAETSETAETAETDGEETAAAEDAADEKAADKKPAKTATTTTTTTTTVTTTTTTTHAAADDIAAAEDEDYGVPMDQVEAVLNATADKSSLTPQMQRMMARQAENTKRVEETIKGTKSNPRWFVPLFCTLMIIGLIWAVCYYLTSSYPIPGIGAWNLLIAFVIIMVGFIMTMWWR
ncbi:cell division protein CrgA [Bifidobacterium simiiventris]|uniref:cell division protein CrgA n=1 Tax=Bifidobacterium simiiventris TaxID=2834434 RepID=UPI001C5A11E4|nr:cell division protein CrgA [Bifidobacterium simiiventris]MBW3079155.1 cell division protein CrgA [Bifidobacterium simiiventris]